MIVSRRSIASTIARDVGNWKFIYVELELWGSQDDIEKLKSR